MAVYKTQGIIIGRHNFGEADRILVVLTPDKGVKRVVAKGVRRIKSKMAGHLELFCRSELMLAEGRNMDVVTSARLISRPDVSVDYDRMRTAYLVAEMINRLGSDGEHPGLFELAEVSLLELEKAADEVLELWFKLRLLDRLGYRPELGSCMVCHANDSNRRYRFSVSLGGIACDGCGQPADQPLSLEQIKFWRLALDQSIEVLRRVEAAVPLSKATIPICNLFYDHIFGRRFRSAEVLT